MKKGSIVYPGSFIGYEEEFMAGKHAFENDGAVYSEVIGVPEVDEANHEAGIRKSTREVRILERGCTVTGIVTLVKQNAVLVELKSAEKDGVKRVVHDRNGSLAVFNIANGYVRSTDEMFRIGDIIRARIIQVAPYGIELETKDAEFGVIKAFGIRSRKPLHLIDGALRDPTTGDAETRKVSTEYSLR
ncbi:MAG: exosome complex RNA-binding protein Csl4 [Candidatus Diapherotrites archaeon]|uniref:Exosome complex RNA-binding protein Csl4 n=1 Tax=Candidatus Iainarchaeum sp. TaxID=3101447 RepID=A0A8T3YJE4_9ARCH|nr:exosome complex RNA-binding protein Csl4 [Candidatus Diapherotrites archaeon]